MVRLATIAPPEMQATTVLSNHELQGSLGRLVEKLAAVRASDAPPRVVASRRRRPWRPGWVLDAVLRVMADREGPMRVAQIHAAIEALFGEVVSKSSVNWCLSAGVGGRASPFVRVARGRYVTADVRSGSGLRRLARGSLGGVGSGTEV